MKPSIGLNSIRKFFVEAANREKAGSSEYGQVMNGIHDLKNQAAHKQLNSLMAKFLLGGAATGAAARGGAGLLNLLSGKGQSEYLPEAPLSFQAGKKTDPAPTPLEEEPYSYSLSDLGGYKLGGALEDTWNGIKGWASGATQESADQFPWGISGPIAAGVGGVYGGWKGVDYLLEKQRKAKLKDEENRAKEEYAAAMQHMSSKMSRDQKLELLHKKATNKKAFLEGFTDYLQTGGAMAAAPLPFMALGSGALTYKVLESRNKERLLEKAMKQRKKDQLLNSPVFAYSLDESEKDK